MTPAHPAFQRAPRDFTPRRVRAQILANLRRWKQPGAWVSAYDEWRDIAERNDDGGYDAEDVVGLDSPFP